MAYLPARRTGAGELWRSERIMDSYAGLYAEFRWQVPEDFNIAEACCGRWAREQSC